MGQAYNIYCDESCHLESDGSNVMVLGAIWCNKEKVKEISERIREYKLRHNLSKYIEIKWNKVSPSKELFFLDLINYFFDDDDLHFRALVADKTNLHHKDLGTTHDEWYYKMYFVMLKTILDPSEFYNVYLDIKDTCGSKKVTELQKVLANNIYDFSRSIVQKVQQIRSDESSLIQLCDLITGAISYANRGLSGNSAKNKLVDLIKRRSGYELNRSTLYRESKVNLFYWTKTKEEG